MDAKLLTESGLKAVLSKNKIKDTGLERALSAYEKLKDDDHDERLDQLAQIGKLAATFKKSKDVAAAKAVADYLDDVVDAADNEEKAVTKEKAAAAKSNAAKAKEEKEKKDKKDDEDEDDEGEDEEAAGDYADTLITALKKLRTLHGEPMKFLLCDAHPLPAVMIGKRIGSRQRKQLTELTDGCKKFLRIGECHFEAGKYVITTEQQVPGLARRVQLSVKNHTGKRFKFAHAGEETEGDEDGPDAAGPEEEVGNQKSAGPQAAAGAAAGGSASSAAQPPDSTAAPSGAKPELGKAPEVWHKTRDLLKTNIDALKKAVKGHYSKENPDLLKEVEQGLGKLDGILGTLDTTLADSLSKAYAAADGAARKAELQNSKSILTNYIQYVKSEPLIAHIDNNPFGVQTNIKKTLGDALAHVAHAIS